MVDNGLPSPQIHGFVQEAQNRTGTMNGLNQTELNLAQLAMDFELSQAQYER